MVRKITGWLSETSSNRLNRRKVIKAVGTAGIAATGFNGSVAALKETVEKQEVEVSTLTGEKASLAIEAATGDNTYQKIASALNKEGLVSRPQASICKLTTYEQQEGHRTVVIPFENKGSQSATENAHVLWMDRDFGEYRVIGFRVSQSVDAGTTTQKSRRYVVNSGEVTSEPSTIHELGGDFGTNAHIPPGGGGGGGCGDLCEASATICDSYNYECWSATAGSYALAISACSSCVGSFFDDATCGGCVAYVAIAYGIDCNLGSGCEEVTGCYECSEYPTIT